MCTSASNDKDTESLLVNYESNTCNSLLGVSQHKEQHNNANQALISPIPAPDVLWYLYRYL